MRDFRRTAGDPVREWDLLLRAYAAALGEHRVLLASMDATADATDLPLPPRFIPPMGIGPIPLELADRARALLVETDGLVALANEILEATPPPAPAPVRSLRTSSTGVTGSFTIEQRM